MGVFATATVAEGVNFGPVPAAITLTDPAVLIAHMTCDVRPNIHTVKVDIMDYKQSSRLSEWTPYVQAARDIREQNLAAEVKDGQLFYRTTRMINAGDELLVWYSQEYAILLAIPEIQSCHIKENGIYGCPSCSQTFRFPNCLRAHMRFKCEKRHFLLSPASVTARPVTSLLGQGLKTVESAKYPVGFPYMYDREESRELTKGQPSPTSSVGSVDSSDGGRHSPNNARKRRQDNENHHHDSSKRPFVESTGLSHCADSDRGKTDMNRNLRQSIEDSEDTGGSAFRKVEKHTSLPRMVAPQVDNISSQYNMSGPRAGLAQSFGQSYRNKPMSEDEKSAMAALTSIYNRHPLGLVGAGNLGAFIPNWNMTAASLTDGNRNPLKVDVLKADDKLSDIHNIENSNPRFKVSGNYSNGRIGNILPFYRSQNPMVEKIIQSALHVGVTSSSSMSLASLSVSQNWCAKCNASFRMTSDLVYHMRSHHSLEHDQVKKKREEKLKCNVCGETFRERHHLTRHMTSHQDM